MSADTKESPKREFDWQCQPTAAAVVDGLVARFLERSQAGRQFAERLLRDTGTRLVDWLDFIAPGEDGVDRDELIATGFVVQELEGATVAEHAGGMFPTVLLDRTKPQVGIKVESVSDFLHVHGPKEAAVDGGPWAPLRMAKIEDDRRAEVWVVERHGYRGFETREMSAAEVAAVLKHNEAYRNRRRRFEAEADGFDSLLKIMEAAVREVGVDRACDLFFSEEREYWMSRNRAGRLQKARQDRLGLGWGNHDHHTYRSSREHFARLVRNLEAVGMQCRERFYAGIEAGWGAQVMEQPVCRVMVFADVDLSPDEVAGDFAHGELEPRSKVGTVGLWCKLHGESMLQAGMHHLEAQFDFTAAREQLAHDGVHSMAPFTDFAYLRQSFTQGENWPVEPSRIAAALAAGSITAEQAERFARFGAIGSHLEILERNEGYKGFNQTGISSIIKRTDPRGQAIGA
jgi:hypothetical protein